jgi:hypothetical protein
VGVQFGMVDVNMTMRKLCRKSEMMGVDERKTELGSNQARSIANYLYLMSFDIVLSKHIMCVSLAENEMSCSTFSTTNKDWREYYYN